MKTNTVLFFISLIIGFAKANDPDGVQFKKIVFKDNKVVAFRSFNMDKVEVFANKLYEKILHRLQTTDNPPGCPTPEGPVSFKQNVGLID